MRRGALIGIGGAVALASLAAAGLALAASPPSEGNEGARTGVTTIRVNDEPGDAEKYWTEERMREAEAVPLPPDPYAPSADDDTGGEPVQPPRPADP